MSSAGYDRQAVADHANNLASKIRSNLTNSMKSLGVDILTGVGTIVVSLILPFFFPPKVNILPGSSKFLVPKRYDDILVSHNSRYWFETVSGRQEFLFSNSSHYLYRYKTSIFYI